MSISHLGGDTFYEVCWSGAQSDVDMEMFMAGDVADGRRWMDAGLWRVWVSIVKVRDT